VRARTADSQISHGARSGARRYRAGRSAGFNPDATFRLRDRHIGQGLRRCLLRAVLLSVVALVTRACADAPRAVSRDEAEPKVLTASQLDTVTVGAAAIFLNLMASAQGPQPIATTEAQSHTVQGSIPVVQLDPEAPEEVRAAHVVAVESVTFLIATGRAFASGQSDATCSTQIESAGNLAYFQTATSKSVTLTTAFCLCAAFGISPNQ
jgi:hypothetical protein